MHRPRGTHDRSLHRHLTGTGSLAVSLSAALASVYYMIFVVRPQRFSRIVDSAKGRSAAGGGTAAASGGGTDSYGLRDWELWEGR